MDQDRSVWSRREWMILAIITTVFLLFFFLPVGTRRFDDAVLESLHLARWYAREHVILCLVPAFFIAGAIAAFVRQASVIRYLGAGANKVLSYGVASVSGTILAVCSCTVLPLFAGIYRMGAGLGPATTFLYSGPAINVLAIILTARVLGATMGIARGVGAIAFSVVIGLLMHAIFREGKAEKQRAPVTVPETGAARPLWQDAVYFGSMVGILVFANWGSPGNASGPWHAIYSAKWIITAIFSVGLAVVLVASFHVRIWRVLIAALPAAALAVLVPGQPVLAFAAGAFGLCALASAENARLGGWFDASWGFAKQILPLLLMGVLVAGVLFGRPGHEGLIPAEWVSDAVGGNSIRANLLASVAGAFMYFATLTEVPIVQGLVGSGMGQGPALALLLAGPALSLPSMLVIRSVLGTKKTVVFVLLVVVGATLSGMIFGLAVQ